MSSRLFAYGTLMCADILRAVCGLDRRGIDAELSGYRRHPVRGEDYPAIIAAPCGRVRGVLYEHIPQTTWQRLDTFEGAPYMRESVCVVIPDGRMLRAWTYVYGAGNRIDLEAGEWDFEAFLEHGKARFERGYRGFRRTQP